ncbi:hypothetical protein D3C84_714190 [compost metagenome]
MEAVNRCFQVVVEQVDEERQGSTLFPVAHVRRQRLQAFVVAALQQIQAGDVRCVLALDGHETNVADARPLCFRIGQVALGRAAVYADLRLDVDEAQRWVYGG